MITDTSQPLPPEEPMDQPTDEMIIEPVMSGNPDPLARFQEEDIPVLDTVGGKAPAAIIHMPADGWTSSVVRDMPRREMVAILNDAAQRNGLRDRDVLAALHLSEDGATDQELGFGIPKEGGPPPPRWLTFDKQAGAAAAQFEIVATRYETNFKGKKAFVNGRFTDQFLEYFSKGGKGYDGYAPLKAKNDRNGLNKYHLNSLLSTYKKIQRQPFDWEKAIQDDAASSQSKDTYKEYLDQLDFYRLKQSMGVITSQTGLIQIIEFIDNFTELDQRGTAKFFNLLQETGLTYTKVDSVHLPETMDGDTFLNLVLGVEPTVIEANPFIYDPKESLTVQIVEWLSSIPSDILKKEKRLGEILLGDIVTPSGALIALSGSAIVRRLGKAVMVGLRKLNIISTDPEKVRRNAAKLSKVKAEIAQRVADKKRIRQIQADSIERIAKAKPSGILDDRTQYKLDNDPLSVNKWETLFNRSKGLVSKINKPISDRAARISLLRSNEFVDEIIAPLAMVYKNEPTRENFSKFLEQWEVFTQIGESQKTGIQAVASSLGAQSNILEKAASSRLRNMTEIVDRGITTPEAMMDNILAMPSIVEQIAFAKKMALPGSWKIYNAQLVGGFLSGASTWLGINFVGNVTNTMMFLAKHQVATFIPGSPIEAHETWTAIKAAQKSFDAEWKLFKRNLSKPEVRFGKTKLEVLDIEEQFSVFKAANLPLPTSLDFIRPGLDKIAHFGQFFVRLSIAEDELTKGLIYQMKLSMEADRYTRSIKGIEKLNPSERLLERNQVAQDMWLNPQNFPVETRRMRHEGADVTLTSPLSPTNEAIIQLANSHPAIKMWMLFMRTPANGFSKTFNEFPIISALKDTANGKLFSKDPHIRSEAIARQTIAGSIAVSTWMMSSEGFFSGAGDPDPEKRAAMFAQGWRPGSFMFDTSGDGVADTFVPVPLGVPLFNIMFIISGLHDSWDFLTNDEQEKAQQMVALTLDTYLEQQPFLDTLNGVMELRGQWTAGHGPKELDEWIKRRGFNYFPVVGTTFSSLRDQVTRAVDPIKREIPGPLNELETYAKTLFAHVPGASKFLSPTIDIYGGYERYTDGWGPKSASNGAFGRMAQLFSPGLTSIKMSRTNDDVRIRIQQQFAVDNGVNLPEVEEVWEGVKLNWNQLQALKLLSGRGRIPKGFENIGLLPTKQILKKSMVEVIEKVILNSTRGKSPIGDSGLFRLTKMDEVIQVIHDQQARAFEKLKKTPLFANVGAEIKLRDAVQPLRHQPDAIGRPTGINVKKLLDLF